MRPCRPRPRNNRGFTLIEVLAALLIASTALMYLIMSETDDIKKAAGTRALRRATILASEKMAELAAGVEGGVNGDFEDAAGYSWTASTEPFAGAGSGCRKVTLIVSYTTQGEAKSVVLERVME